MKVVSFYNTMSGSFSFSSPDKAFWQHYSNLWQHSIGRSPFQSPQLLQYFSSLAGDDVCAFQYYNAEGDLYGAVLLEDSSRGYHFLSDRKTDANFFTLHEDCTDEEVEAFFFQLLETIKATNKPLTLNNQPAWAPYQETLEKVGKASGLYWVNIPYSVCPVAKAESPKALFDSVNSLRELRYRVNKLKNQQQASFEVYTDDADLDHWTDEFCDAHILRWQDTSTPSAFRDPERRHFLKECLHAWNREGILVRFSVRVQESRVGFVVGLREANSLIHHSTTFHPDFWKYSPGKALIHFMAEWMRDQNLDTLDFGDGNEPYKYTVANQENLLHRIFVADKSNYRYILKSRVVRYIREHPKTYAYYLARVKPVLAQLTGWLPWEVGI
ncbi:MAG: GNAT family N-acetyltransferase [Bacteroidetes bacterium]|nr:MAG: GNAT family N-acetyltransferase [Bacteroidota bacterium]